MKRVVFYILLIFISTKLFGQDARFSQFSLTPTLINPAESGAIDADYRGQIHYRNQWAVLGESFRNYAAMGDAALFRSTKKPNYLGAGLVIHRNEAGKSQLSQLRAEAQAAYHLTGNKKNIWSTGLSLAFVQRSINFDGLLWDSQYNGVGVDPSLASGEQFFNESRSTVDAGLGFLWRHRGRQSYNIGYSWRHFLQDQGFLENTADPLLPTQSVYVKWLDKMNFVDVNYDVLLIRQAGAMQILAGALLKYRFGLDSRYTTSKTSSMLLIGCHLRYGDALIPSVGYEFQRSFQLMMSYDINVSALNEVSQRRGGLEFCLIYTGTTTPSRRKLR
ncbi:MAG: PorP/SprF family type IX secretion system membrane protein [Flavobacteriales bacterium]|nr:PorP/SprF family type IX secretion system membrane protein [Flavobacteriales bacterium]MDG1766654.1 PorP/SprF family type IX secretion system membrane protein [Flavobacteriales bacterium]